MVLLVVETDWIKYIAQQFVDIFVIVRKKGRNVTIITFIFIVN